MPRARWTPQARADLKAIAKYIARHGQGPMVADRLVDAIRAKCDANADFFPPASDRERGQPVQPERREQNREPAENGRELRDEAFLRVLRLDLIGERAEGDRGVGLQLADRSRHRRAEVRVERARSADADLERPRQRLSRLRQRRIDRWRRRLLDEPVHRVASNTHVAP